MSRNRIETLAAIQSIETNLYTCFYSIEPVQSIYLQALDEIHNVFVFLKQDRYDEGLMDCLLEQESDIVEQYPEILFNFHYLPLLDNIPPAIPENATLVFGQ